MKALESLRDAASRDEVRTELLDALEHDANPGVRVEAVNVLVGSLQHGETVENAREPDDSKQLVKPGSQETDPSVERVVRVLQQLQRRDPSPYVRVRSAAALRQIGPREVQCPVRRSEIKFDDEHAFLSKAFFHGTSSDVFPHVDDSHFFGASRAAGLCR